MQHIQCNNFCKVKTKLFIFETLRMERVWYGTEKILPYFRTVVYQKIPYIIPYCTFFQNSTVSYRTQVPAIIIIFGNLPIVGIITDKGKESESFSYQ